MKALTKRQQKIIYSGVIVAVTIIVVLFFVYLPVKAKLEGIKKELADVESQIAALNELSHGRELADVVSEFTVQSKDMSDLLPSREEEVVRALSEKARNAGIVIQNIVPSEKIAFDKHIAGLEIEKQKISMDLVCNFRMLAEYLHMLRNEFPFLVSIEALTVEGQGEGKRDLLVSVRLSANLVKLR